MGVMMEEKTIPRGFNPDQPGSIHVGQTLDLEVGGPWPPNSGLRHLPRIIGICGHGRAGKDSVADYLRSHYDYHKASFGDPVKELAMRMNPAMPRGFVRGDRLVNVVARHGWTEAKDYPEVRELLQRLGAGGRSILGADVWINSVFEGIGPNDRVVIPSVRFRNEVQRIRREGGAMLRVTRPGYDAVNDHPMEKEHENFAVDRAIFNDGTLAELESMVDAVMMSW
jgi:hypothetical protein